MSKIDWDKADRHQRDPGSVRDVDSELICPSKWVPRQERKRRAAEKAKEAREAKKQTEQRQMDFLSTRVEEMIRRKQAAGEPLNNLEKMIVASWTVRP